MLAGFKVKPGAVPGANNAIAIQVAINQGAVIVGANIRNGVNLAIKVNQPHVFVFVFNPHFLTGL